MSEMTTAPAAASETRLTGKQRKAIVAGSIGNAVEWVDWAVYGTLAPIFPSQFFAKGDPAAALLSTLAVFAVGFVMRPVGGALLGAYADRHGRKKGLTLTIGLMAGAALVIAVCPTYEAIGIAAPIMLVLLRILQGISAGGEWGGAVLMAVEHAPKAKRGLFGASPQIGVPLGLLLASGIMALMTVIAPGDAFLAWGWRVPFLLSVVLIFIGYYVRRRVEESPVFVELAERKEQTRMPIIQLFKRHALLVLIAALVFAGNNAVGYMTTGGYIQNYSTNPEGPIGLDRGPVLWAVAGSAVTWLLSTFFAGWISDRIGRRNTYIIGWVLQLLGVFLLFPLVNTGEIGMLFLGLAILTIGLGFTYGPQAALYSELFPASIRFSGVSISYAIGAILGGAFAPTIATALVQATGSTESVTWYLAGMTLIGLTATLLLRDRSGIPLGPDSETEQTKSPVYGLARA